MLRRAVTLKTLSEPVYHRASQPAPKLGAFQVQLEQWLEIESRLPKRQRRTAQRLFEGLQAEGYRGSYDPVQCFVKRWKSERSGRPAVTQAFVPLAFPPGETCQFDWSHEEVELGGVDRNRYSVPAIWAGKVVSVRLTADRLRVVAEGQIIAEHVRHFGRDQLICDPWHYLPVLEQKPGALRHGAPFQTWDLPVAIRVVRDRILKYPKGDRAFVELLLLAREVGLEVLEVACQLTLEAGVITAPVVLNAMRRLSAPSRLQPLDGAPAPQLHTEPVADCSRYDSLREVSHVH